MQHLCNRSQRPSLLRNPRAEHLPRLLSVPGEAGYPCLFYPTTTCRRDPCPFIHDTGSSSSRVDPKAKAKGQPKAKPKAVPSAVAAASVLSSLPGVGAVFRSAVALMPLMLQNLPSLPLETPQLDIVLTSFDADNSTISWILDSGAGRTVGRSMEIPQEFQGLSNNPVSFATGGGKKQGEISCRISGELSGESECYLLESSPWALSLGELIRKGKAFVWLPDSDNPGALPLPYLVNREDVKHLSAQCPEQCKVYATRTKQNVPIFEEHVEVNHMAIDDDGASNAPTDPPLEEATEDSGGRVGEHEKVDASHKGEVLEPAPVLEEDLSSSFEHDLLHLPKDPYCQICQQAKQDSLPARKFGGLHPLTDGHVSTAFGDRIHADHVIVAMSKTDRHLFGAKGERVALVLWDDFTKLVGIYPAQTKNAHECVKALRHFLGKQDGVEFHCDNAPELEATAHELGLIHTPTVPYRKIAIINRQIRTIEDSCRCALVQAGRWQAFWTHAIQYVGNVMSFQHWKSLHDEDWFGEKAPFAALVRFRPNERESKLGPKTTPALFMGWRLEPGFGFRGVYKVAPLDSIRSFLDGKAPLKVTTLESCQ